MIFVTVGTHEQQFNRLVQCIDELKRDNHIKEEVVIQTGYCTYEPKYCTWSKLFPYEEMGGKSRCRKDRHHPWGAVKFCHAPENQENPNCRTPTKEIS